MKSREKKVSHKGGTREMYSCLQHENQHQGNYATASV